MTPCADRVERSDALIGERHSAACSAWRRAAALYLTPCRCGRCMRSVALAGGFVQQRWRGPADSFLGFSSRSWVAGRQGLRSLVCLRALPRAGAAMPALRPGSDLLWPSMLDGGAARVPARCWAALSGRSRWPCTACGALEALASAGGGAGAAQGRCRRLRDASGFLRHCRRCFTGAMRSRPRRACRSEHSDRFSLPALRLCTAAVGAIAIPALRTGFALAAASPRPQSMSRR